MNLNSCAVQQLLHMAWRTRVQFLADPFQKVRQALRRYQMTKWLIPIGIKTEIL